jgi:hypothetical protein
VCACEQWVNVFYSTIFLRQALKKLEGLDVRRRDYRFQFGKVLRKAEGVRERVDSKQ